jgi:hypothetical protein
LELAGGVRQAAHPGQSMADGEGPRAEHSPQRRLASEGGSWWCCTVAGRKRRASISHVVVAEARCIFTSPIVRTQISTCGCHCTVPVPACRSPRPRAASAPPSHHHRTLTAPRDGSLSALALPLRQTLTVVPLVVSKAPSHRRAASHYLAHRTCRELPRRPYCRGSRAQVPRPVCAI